MAKQTEPTDISYTARFKNDDEWLYILYEATWTSSFSSPESAAVSMFFFSGNPTTDNDAGWVGFTGNTWDPFGWTGGMWMDGLLADPPGTNDVEGIGYFDGDTYWFAFRKRLDSGDGYDWSFKPGDLMGNRIAPEEPPHMLVAFWDSDTQSTYEQIIALQLSTLEFNARKLNTKMMKFQRNDDVVHLFGFNDAGRPGQPPAVVKKGRAVIFGFEWAADNPEMSVDDLRAMIIGNPDHKITCSIDGSSEFSVKSWYQEPFFAETRVEISPYLREPKDAAEDMPRPEHYMRDPSDAQGKYMEIWVEKATNIPLLRHIVAKWYVPLIATAGNTSVTFKHEAAERFKSRQHLDCVVLYLSDLDADGQYFPVLLDEWFREVEGIDFVEVRQVLLKHEHIKRYNLPIQLRVYKKEHERKAYVQDFIKQHGRIQVEIDALPVDDLRSLVEQEMQGLLSQRVITKVRRQSQVDARKMLVPLYKQGL